MPEEHDILILTDIPGCGTAADLEILYPDRLKRLDFRTEKHGVSVLRQYRAVVVQVNHGVNLPKLKFDALDSYARGGGQVICCLFEYAAARGLRLSKTHVCDRMRPGIRIEAECDVTRGFAVGDETWWFGTVSSAPDSLYENQMVQRQLFGVSETGDCRILATSTVNGGAVMVEEQVGKGRIVAMDLLSPGRPYYNSHGSTNKYLFAGNIIGGSVRYGKQYPNRWSYDEFVEQMRQLASRFPQLGIVNDGPCSDGRAMWSFELGDPAKPTVYLGAAVHGWEWENAFGLLRLTELLCESPGIEGLDIRGLHFRIMPIQNPAGYDAFTRQNARGVDLNRNFDVAWEELPVVQDVATPWDYNYKGTRPASEPETQAIQAIIDRHRPICAIDFHTADYIMLMPHRGDDELCGAIQANIQRRLKDRYLAQAPYNGPYQQVNMDRKTEREKMPYLVCYAAECGAAAAFLVEMSGNRDDVHAMVMNTDTVVEICLASVQECLGYLARK